MLLKKEERGCKPLNPSPGSDCVVKLWISSNSAEKLFRFDLEMIKSKKNLKQIYKKLIKA